MLTFEKARLAIDDTTVIATFKGKNVSIPISVSKTSLAGKKIIFIGNSHTFYGNVVQTKDAGITALSNRTGDTGFFSNIAKENGATNISITNWTFGNHGLRDLFSGLRDLFSGDCQADRNCGNGHDHLADLSTRSLSYEYVVLQ